MYECASEMLPVRSLVLLIIYILGLPPTITTFVRNTKYNIKVNGRTNFKNMELTFGCLPCCKHKDAAQIALSNLPVQIPSLL